MIFSIFFLFSVSILTQEYSSKRVVKFIERLSEYSTDSSFFYDDITFLIVDNWTEITIYEKENYVDNKIHKMFLKIVRCAKIKDLLLMSKSNYPNIRVYAFWALLKRNQKVLANNILNKEVEKKKEKVWFDSFGDLIIDYSPTDLMKELIRIENHVQNE